MLELIRKLKLKPSIYNNFSINSKNYSNVNSNIKLQMLGLLISLSILVHILSNNSFGTFNSVTLLQTMDIFRSQERSFRFNLGEKINKQSKVFGELYFGLNSFVDGVLNVTSSIFPLENLNTDPPFAIGDHLYVNRGYYLHHGIYIGQGRVIGYYGEFTNPADTKVRVVTLEQFSEGEKIHKKYEQENFPPMQIVSRALSVLGKKDYHVVFNNCEQFVIWCTEGYDPLGYYR